MSDNFGASWPYGACRQVAKAQFFTDTGTCGYPLWSDGTCPNARNHIEPEGTEPEDAEEEPDA